MQGTGWLTSEELVWDETGRLRTHAPSTYKVPLASDRPLSMVELTEQRFVTYPPESVMYRMTADLCREAGFQHRVSQMAQETSTILSFVAAGGGVALMPASVRSVQLRGVRYRELEDIVVYEAEIEKVWQRAQAAGGLPYAYSPQSLGISDGRGHAGAHRRSGTGA